MDLSGKIVEAEVYDAYDKLAVRCCVIPWLQQATDVQILRLASAEFGGYDSNVLRVVEFMAECNDKVSNFIRSLATLPTPERRYSCYVCWQQTVKWLEINKREALALNIKVSY